MSEKFLYVHDGETHKKIRKILESERNNNGVASIMSVELTPAEVLQGAQAGIMRQTKNIGRKLKHRYGASTENDWQMHVEGCLGEMVVAKYLNMFWDGAVGIPHHGDIGRLEVRTSNYETARLIVHDRDLSGSIFILVTGRNGSYSICGWIKGEEAKQGRFWKDPAGGRPAYFVPQSELNEIEKLYLRYNV